MAEVRARALGVWDDEGEEGEEVTSFAIETEMRALVESTLEIQARYSEAGQRELALDRSTIEGGVIRQQAKLQALLSIASTDQHQNVTIGGYAKRPSLLDATSRALQAPGRGGAHD